MGRGQCFYNKSEESKMNMNVVRFMLGKKEVCKFLKAFIFLMRLHAVIKSGDLEK